MGSLLRHAQAFQISAAAVLVTAALTALPILAADQFDESYYAGQIVSIFQKTGASSPGVYSNASLALSAFDFASYFSDTCYRPTDFDMEGCKNRFGPYWNLKTTYDSGKLASILSGVSYLKDIAVLLPGGAPQSSSSSSSPASSEMTSSASSRPEITADFRAERAAQVWRICTASYENRASEARCYQQNIRLIMEHTEEITAEIVIRGE